MAQLEEIFQLEEQLENGFQSVLDSLAKCFHSRETDVAVSPRIEVKIIVGKVLNHMHIFSDNRTTVWDAWDGRLETMIVTNRAGEKASKAHNIMLGAVRAKLQLFALVPIWRAFQDVVILTDIREDGTEDTFVDENDLDYSQINWQIFFNINPQAWPQGI